MSDEASNNDGATESSSDSAKEPSPETPDASEERETRKANARAVGVDTAFLDALGDEFSDAPAPVGKYGPGGTLVAENADELEKVTGLPKTKLPPPPPGLSPKKERDEVLKKDFLQETTPTLELEGRDDGEVLFESAAVGASGSERLDLKSGPNPVVPGDDDGLPDVLASFDSEASDPGQSGDALVVSVGPDAAAEVAESEPEPDPKPEPKDEPADDDDAKVAVVAAKAEPKKAEPKKAEPKKAEPKKAAAAAPVSPRPAANDGPDIQKYAVIGIAALLLLLGGYALMGGGDEPKPGEVAQASAAGKDKAAPAADEGGGHGGGAGEGGGGDGGGDADQADDGSTPAGANGEAADGEAADGEAAAGEASDSAAEGEAAAATDAEEAAADGVDTEGSAEASTGEVDIAIEDDDGDGGGGGGVAPMPGNAEKKKERAAEDEMTAKELRDAAKAALKKRKYGDAYRLSGKAVRKESTEPAHAIRVEAACGLKNQAAAKSAFERINTGKVKRDLRSACRDHGVRLGL